MADMMEYKCPSCGGAMEFDSTTQKMKCPYCDTAVSYTHLDVYKRQSMSFVKNWGIETSFWNWNIKKKKRENRQKKRTGFTIWCKSRRQNNFSRLPDMWISWNSVRTVSYTHLRNRRNRWCQRNREYIWQRNILSDRCSGCSGSFRSELSGKTETGLCGVLWCLLLWEWLSADRCTWQCSVSSGAWGSGGSRRPGRQYHRAAETIG